MGGTIYDPSGSSSIDTGQAPALTTSTTTDPPVPSGPAYVKIVVPNFNGATGTQPPMGTYLRLGAIEPDVPPGVATNPTVNGVDPSGEDLASIVTTTLPDGTEVSFADDQRDRSDGGESNQLPFCAPQTLPPGTASTTLLQESSRQGLHGKGGWRDHTDGNRITTTRGDKIEVIRGNYKMVILGRQNLTPPGMSDYDLDDWATGYDESGGLSDNQDQAHGVNGVLAISYNWESDSDGRWGWTQRTTTGTFDTSLNPGSTPGNGKQIGFTWVDEMQSFTGGPQLGDPVYTLAPAPPAVGASLGIDAQGNKRVNRIYNRTWVNVLDEATDAAGGISEALTTAKDYTESYNVTGTHTVNTTVGSENDTTKVGGDITTQLTANTMHETVQVSDIHNISSEAGHMNERLVVHGVHTVTDASVARMEFDLSAMWLTFSATLFIIEIKSMFHIDCHQNHFDVHFIHNDFHLGPHFQVALMGHVELTPDEKVTMSMVNMFL